MNGKPNILMIMGDQHPLFMTGCYGDRFAQTPNLDRLSAAGATFDAAYSPSPLCAPARACMMTGVHVGSNEVWDNAAPLRSDWPTFAHSFAAAGYRTALCGKMHFVGPDQYHGFEERWTPDIYPAGFDWTYPSRGGVYVPPEGKGQAAHRVHQSGIYRSKDMDYDDNVYAQALSGLREIGEQRDERRPFFLCVSFAGPHYPFAAPEYYWRLFDDDRVPMPNLPEDYQESDPQYIKWFRDYAKLNEPIPEAVVRRARHAIYARLAMLDDYIGGLMDALESAGLAQDTLIVYTSDHGDMMGEHGLWFKCTAYEGSCRVPLIFTGPGMSAQRVSTPVSLVDLGPTLCSLARIEPVYPAAAIDGKDFSELLTNPHTRVDDSVRTAMAEYYGDGTWKGWRMLRRHNLKLVQALDCRPVLYDLESDPGEWHDLSQSSDYASALAEMTDILTHGWNPVERTEACWQSQERRRAILAAAAKSRIDIDWNLDGERLRKPIGKTVARSGRLSPGAMPSSLQRNMLWKGSGSD